jgi:3-deoxy-D-manno-octulosonate 8-phosphate phosphatase (KDO 8-P phosphatase)
MTGIKPSEVDGLLLERAKKVQMLVLDVDGILTDGRLYFDNQGNEMKAFATRDGYGMKALQHFGIRIGIITGRESQIVAQRAAQLEVDYVYQGRNDKLNAFNDLLEKSGVSEEAVCYAGDDWIDIPVLDRVGLAVTVPDADPVVRSRAHWITKRTGGMGAVREICDLILTAKGLDQQLLEEILEL